MDRFELCIKLYEEAEKYSEIGMKESIHKQEAKELARLQAELNETKLKAEMLEKENEELKETVKILRNNIDKYRNTFCEVTAILEPLED